MCKFDCSKFLGECKAACCEMIPIEEDLYAKNIDKIVTMPIRLKEFNEIDPLDNIRKDFILPMTNTAVCCFLQADYQCAIYNERPKVCRVFGDETNDKLLCHWQDKDGNKRSRQVTRMMHRKSSKELRSFLKKIR